MDPMVNQSNDACPLKFQELENYLRTQMGHVIIEKPQGEPWGLFDASVYIQKKRELKMAQKALEQQWEVYSSRMKVINEKKNEVAQKHDYLLSYIKNFGPFLEDNKNKTILYKKKAVEERKIQKSKEQTVLELRKLVNNLTKKRDRLMLLKKKHSVAKNFLSRMAENLPEFSDFSDIVSRYKTLRNVYEELENRRKRLRREVEEEIIKLNHLKTQKRTELLMYSNKMAEQQVKFEKIVKDILKNDAQWNLLKSAEAEAVSFYGVVRLSIGNLYTLVMSQSGVPRPHVRPATDLFQKLKVIKRYIVDFQETLAILQTK